MSVNRKIKRKQDKDRENLLSPFKELKSILDDTSGVVSDAIKIKNSLSNFLSNLEKNGSPIEVTSIIKGMIESLDKEINIIDNTKKDYNSYLKEAESSDESKLFELSSVALDLSTTVMTSAMNLGTTMMDIERLRNRLLNPTTGDTDASNL